MRRPLSTLAAAVALAAPLVLVHVGPAAAAPPAMAAATAATTTPTAATATTATAATATPAAGTTAVSATSSTGGAAQAPRDVAVFGGGYELSVVDLTTDQRAINLGGFREIRGVAMLPARRRAYVADRLANQVVVVDTTTMTVVDRITGLSGPAYLQVDPRGTDLYVAAVSGDVAVIDTATDTISRIIRVDSALYGLVLSPDGTRAYVSTGLRGAVRVIDTASGTEAAPITGFPYATTLALSPDGASLYVGDATATDPDHVMVSVVDTATGTVRATVHDPAAGTSVSDRGGLALSADGAHLYVTDTKAGAVVVVDTAHDTVQTVVPATPGAHSVVVTPDERRLYVGGDNTYQSTVIDTATAAAVGTFRGAVTSGGAFTQVVPVAPTAVLTVQPMCRCVSIRVDESATRPGLAPITMYATEFGNGSAWFLDNTGFGQYGYPRAGRYTVTLTVTDGFGLTDRVQVPVAVQMAGDTVGLLSDPTLNYVSLDPNGTRPLTADRTAIGPTEKFSTYYLGDDLVAIAGGPDDRYLAVDPANGDLVTASSDNAFAPAAAFQLDTDPYTGATTVRSALTGRYLTANDGTRPMTASATDAGPAEHFHLAHPAAIAMRAAANGRYVTAEAGGAQPLIANRDAVGPWEQFDVLEAGMGYFAFLAHANHRFVTEEAGGAQPLIANRTAIGAWERFLVQQSTGDTSVLLPGYNQRYVCAEAAGTQPLIANREVIGDWEKFTIVQL